MDEEQARKASRVRELLAGYYGMEQENAAGGKGAGQPTAQAAVPEPSGGSFRNAFRRGANAAVATAAFATLDSPTFDANQHLVSMLKASSLERLMVEHRNTAKEIKNLDTDMQQLVTENYHKFIAATDTIRVMKGEVDRAMPDLNKLSTIMNNVSERSTTISNKLQARQNKMEELYRVQALLQKLQAVFDLPKRMRAALEEDVLDTAVSFYAEAQPLLRKYGHKGIFRQIAADSDLVAKEISQVLKRRLAERKDDTESCVLLLRKLGEPDDTLQDRYLAGRASRLRKILKDASAVADAMASYATMVTAPAGSPIKASATSAMAVSRSQLEAAGTWGFSEDGAPPGLRQFVRALDEKLINAMQETTMNVTRFFMSKDLSEEEAVIKRKPLIALAKEVFADYFAIVKRAIADSVAASTGEAAKLYVAAAANECAAPPANTTAHAAAGATNADEDDLSLSSPLLNFSTSWGTEALAQGLSTVSADLSLVAGGLPELGLRERAANLVAGAVTHHIDSCFGALKARIQGAVNGFSSRLAAQPGAMAGDAAASAGLLGKAYKYLVDLISKGLDALMQGLKAYEAQATQRLLASSCPHMMRDLQAALQNWFLELLASFLSVAGIRYDGSDRLRLALRHKHSRTGSSMGSEDLLDSWKTSPQMAALLATVPNDMNVSRGAAGMPASTAAAADVYTKSGLLLLLAKLCTYIEQSTVPWVMTALADSFSGRFKGAVGNAANPDLEPAFIPGEVARKLAAASSSLLSAYVECHGRQLSLAVRRSMALTDWLKHKEPRNPRPVCDLLVERLSKAEAEVVQLVEESGRRTDGTPGIATSAAARNERGFAAGLLLETGNVERSLAKIFKEKVKIFGAPVQFTQAAILGGIAGVGLKSLVECVRLQILGRAGLQQLQLDSHYLRPLLRRFTGGQPQQVVDSLLDEVVSAGVERSLDPTLLEPSVLDRILTSMDGAN